MPTKTVDLTEFVALSKPRRMKCTIALALEAVKERESLEAAIADESITTAGISKWLVLRGHNIKAATVRRHRNGECSCDD